MTFMSTPRKPRPPIGEDTVSTAAVMAARGVRDRKTLYRDVQAGLFADLPRWRTSAGCRSPGVWLEWPRRALQRARWIRLQRERGLFRDEIAAALLSGTETEKLRHLAQRTS